MKLTRLADIYELIRPLDKKNLVAVNAIDEHSLTAIADAVRLNIINAIITGDRSEILKQCEELQIDPALFQIIHVSNEVEAAEVSVRMVKSLSGGILMKGMINSNKYLKAILDKKVGLLPEGGILSHVSVIDNANYHKLLMVSDVAVIPIPTIPQKIAMAHYLKQMALMFGIEKPKIAIIAPTELIIPSLVSTTDAVELMKEAQKGTFEPAIVYGPMALDVALDGESAQIKNITSEVAGDADCLLFSNIDSGNIFYKVNTKLCKADQAAIVMGGNVPMILSSRGDNKQTKLNSIALAALLSK
ncbi:MAG TPA: phosphate acyltransferase [Prolixibacteraceae bacterium]|nr:phosphate acyltransferase [Prolixibacteraceae bacterium]